MPDASEMSAHSMHESGDRMRIQEFSDIDYRASDLKSSANSFVLGQVNHIRWELVRKAVTACHSGYRRLGAIHRRSVLCFPQEDLWIVVDDVTGSYSGEVRLHWLFPDVPFRFDLDPIRLLLQFPEGDFHCMIAADHVLSTNLAKAGEIIGGTADASLCEREIRGWRSLYYGSKEPALSLGLK